MRRRLANFLHLFPGHTANGLWELAYDDWEALALAVDANLAEQKKQRARTPRRGAARKR